MAIRPTDFSPDQVERDRLDLAAAVLSDIAAIMRTVAPEGLFVVEPLLDAVQATIEAPEGRRGSARGIGPELFYWLGSQSWALRHHDREAVNAGIERLPSLLLGRLIGAGASDGRCQVPAHGGYVRLPQAGADLRADGAGRLATVEWSPDVIKLGETSHDRAEIADAVDGASAVTPRVAGSTILYHQRGDCLHRMMSELDQTASQPVGAHENLAIVPLEEFQTEKIKTIRGKMDDGLALLRTHSPDHAAEVETAIERITLIGGRRFVGGSDIWYQGVAILNMDDDWSTTTYADHLVHEGAHIILHASNELSPYLLNGGMLGAKSPIREDARPLYSIFHSTFVFLRLVLFFQTAAEKIGTDESMFRLHRHLLGFYEGMDELTRFARFTPKGEAFFRAMLNARDGFRASLPAPDPKFYKRIGNDYVV